MHGQFEPGNKAASYNNTRRFLEKKNKIDWGAKHLNTFKGKKAVKLYNKLRMENESLKITQEQYKQIAEVYRPDIKNPVNQIISTKNFLNNDTVKKFANEELYKILDENNINLDYLVKEKKKLIKLSKKEKQFNVTLKTIESFENNLGLNNKTVVTERRQINTDLGKISQTIEQEQQNREEVQKSEENKE